MGWEHWTSIYETPPSAPGWYAVTYCWDANEGVFPGAFYWNGNAWVESEKEQEDVQYPIGERSPEPFPNKRDALVWAYKYDPECGADDEAAAKHADATMAKCENPVSVLVVDVGQLSWYGTLATVHAPLIGDSIVIGISTPTALKA